MLNLTLFKKLRNLGYTLPEALAELVDNSIKAKSKNVWIYMYWSDDIGKKSYVMIVDDGEGMDEDELLNKALAFPKEDKIDEGEKDLSKFGLGLKTGSFQHCKAITVITKKNKTLKKTLDCDIGLSDKMPDCIEHKFVKEHLDFFEKQKSGTIILWSGLDRLVSLKSRDRALNFYNEQDKAKKHFKLIYHKFLINNEINIFFGGNEDIHKVKAWDPFYKNNPEGIKLESAEINFYKNGKTLIDPWIIPENLPYNEITNHAKNELQGLYFFRKNRLLSYGGWFELGRDKWSNNDRYNRLRIEIDIPRIDDEHWITIQKYKVIIPEFAIYQLQKHIGLARRKYIEKIRAQL